ncbi:MAG: hypothetical protein AAFV38_08760 [Pseudomonadota bacterium]
MSDVLECLKVQLMEKQAAVASLKSDIEQLKLAVSAIEDAQKKPPPPKRRGRRRGEITQGILDCIREGEKKLSGIHEALKASGIEAEKASISNALSRLQDRRIIARDNGGYFSIREVEESNPRSLEKVQNANGPTAETARPSQMNGAAV